MQIYPYKFVPIYKEKIWGGRNLQRLFDRELPGDDPIGESWELADLEEGVSCVSNGPEAGATLTDLTRTLGKDLLGGAKPFDGDRFPLLLKLLDANDILSLQVHPDRDAVKQMGPPAALKTECWYVLESRDGMIYKGVKPGVSKEQFAKAVEDNTVENLVKRYDVSDDDFHFLPAGTVHALGAGVVVAEVQTPSDTTYRVSDWGRGREIHIEKSLQCIHFEPAEDEAPGCEGERLLQTEFFDVFKRTRNSGTHELPGGRCAAWMVLEGSGRISGDQFADSVEFRAGDTVLIPAVLQNMTLEIANDTKIIETLLPESE